MKSLIVIDTCVLVSAARSRNGASFKLLSLLPSTHFDIALTVPLYIEYQAVLTRPEHLPPGLGADAALGFIRYLASIAKLVDVYFLWRPMLRDPDDDMVLECAVACGSTTIVTHNVKDFRRAESLGVSAITPADFLARTTYSMSTSFVNAKAKRRQYKRTASEADKFHG